MSVREPSGELWGGFALGRVKHRDPLTSDTGATAQADRPVATAAPGVGTTGITDTAIAAEGVVGNCGISPSMG